MIPLMGRDILKSNTKVELIKKGKDCFNRAEYKKAELIFNEVVEIDKSDVDAFFYLGNIFHLKGEIGKSIQAFKKVLDLQPEHTDASISLSVLYNDIGKYDEGKKIFEVANERVKSKQVAGNIEDPHINKKFAQKHYDIAELYYSYNRFDEALFDYNKAIGLDPSNLEARIKIAKVYAKKGFIIKSFEVLRKLKNEHPNYEPARVALGILHYGNGNVIEAQTEWKKVLSQNPHNSEAAMYLNLSKTATETTLT